MSDRKKGIYAYKTKPPLMHDMHLTIPYYIETASRVAFFQFPRKPKKPFKF